MNFEAIKENAKKEWLSLSDNREPVIYIGTATCGRSAGALAVMEAIKTEEKIKNSHIIETGCLGPCFAEPIVMIKKYARPLLVFGKVKPGIAARLVVDYLREGKIDYEYVLGSVGSTKIDGVDELFDSPVMKPQVRRILRNCGFIDPGNINHFIALGGYSGLQKALALHPDEVIEIVRDSGLRGRGGAGFPTWKKWKTARDAANGSDLRNHGSRVFIVCNADEGDPGAFMNRALLEGDPHSVLEGLLIAGYTIGADRGYIYCRAEYPLALSRLKTALNQMRDLNLLGEHILGTDFSFDIRIKEGAGAFVCGEETALIASIEGRRGTPRPRPPYPAQVGLWGKPTVINNVETFANVALIVNNGSDWFAEHGTENSRGTKTFSLAGKIKFPGLIEVPLGITLKEIIYDIGGGPADDKNFKAVQTGGPSGGCLNSEMLNLPIDYDSLEQAGAIMGSGGLVVMDEDTCMVDVARYFLEFTQIESCGKCVPCRLGTKAMLDILSKITEGVGSEEDLTFLRNTGIAVKNGSLCGLGKTAPNPVLSTIRYFEDEYIAHVKEKKCAGKTCKSMITYYILEDDCTGCTVCMKMCPHKAIIGASKEVHRIIQEECIRCNICIEYCKNDAIEVT